MQFTSLLLAGSAAAFPSVMNQVRSDPNAPSTKVPAGCGTSKLCNTRMDIPDSQVGWTPGKPNPAQVISAARTNCGAQNPLGCSPFVESAQKVSIDGEHAYASPAPDEIRGPCPGLNAAANHAYLPRSGIANIFQTIDGLGQLYGMGADLAGFLAAYAVVFDGDIITQTWSIGGPPPSTSLGSGILSKPQGISWSHNKYEGDSSIGRCDAYINNGDAHSLSTVRFSYAYSTGLDNDRYTLDKFAREFAKNAYRSEAQNPNYFAPLFSTTLVSPAAYNFVINFMSNHSTEEPSGYLNGEMFKTFFAIQGDYPNFEWLPGQERVPENWYRRPLLDAYGAAAGVFGDLAAQFLAYPSSIRFGGNTNGVNSYKGIDVGQMTGGAYNNTQVFQNKDSFQCLIYQTLQQAVPDQLQGGLNDVTKALALLTPYMDKAFGGLTCPQITQFNNNNLDGFPGRSYSPTGAANTC